MDHVRRAAVQRIAVVRPSLPTPARGGYGVGRVYASTGAGRTYLSPLEFERIAGSLNAKRDAQACHALTLYLRTSRDVRKRSTASTALKALNGEHDLAPPLISLVLAARLAVCERPSLATLQEVCAEYPGWEPSDADYTHLLHTLCRQRHMDALEVWRTMQARAINVSTSATNAVLSTALMRAPMADVHTILHQVGGAEKLDRVGLTTLLQGYCNRVADTTAFPALEADFKELDAPSEAEVHVVAEMLRPILQETPDALGWHGYLTYKGLLHGPEAAFDCAQSALARNAFNPDAFSMTTLAMCHIHHQPPESCDEALALLDRLSTLTSLRPDRYVTALLLQALLGYAVRIGYQRPARPIPDPGCTIEAQAFLEEVCALYKIQPDAALLQPLIEAHCYAFVPALDAAYRLLQYLQPVTQRSLFFRKKEAAPRTDLGTYYPLLMACVKLHDVTRALELLGEMKHISVPSHAATTLVTQLWGVCQTHQEAWQVYQAMRRIGTMDAASYAHLLATCCRLRLYEDVGDDAVSPVPAAYPLQLLGDMRAAGFHPSPATYTVLLDYYAKSSRANLAVVQTTHELIKRDVHLEPDLILVNALMNAYNHVNAPAHVLGIWDSLVVLCSNAGSLSFIDEVSLVVVLDACGRSGLLSPARRALESARQLEQRFGGPVMVGKNARDAWMECLARCGRLDESIEVLFSMQKTADVKSVQTVMRFAAAAHARGTLLSADWDALRSRVRSTYVDMWSEVAQIV